MPGRKATGPLDRCRDLARRQDARREEDALAAPATAALGPGVLKRGTVTLCLQNPHMVSSTVRGVGLTSSPVPCGAPISGLVGVSRGCRSRGRQA